MTTEMTAPPHRATRFGLRPPRSALKWLEPRALIEAAAAVPAAPLLRRAYRGDGRAIMVIPGFLTDDRATWPLRRFLGYLDYTALPWGLGRNRGRPETNAERVLAALEERHPTDEPLTLIGWSLGGVIARLVARHAPARVREVITLGTPVEGGPKYTAAGQRFARDQGLDLDRFEAYVHDINAEGIEPPLTVIYSRGDGIVDWRAAIDRYNAHARHVRVPGSHIGLGANPLVWRAIARTLHASQ